MAPKAVQARGRPLLLVVTVDHSSAAKRGASLEEFWNILPWPVSDAELGWRSQG